MECIYRPSNQNNQYFLENSESITDFYSSIYDNYIILGDFNMEPNCPALTSFMHHLTCLIQNVSKKYKNVSKVQVVV